MVDYMHTQKEDSAIIIDSTLEQIGTAPDGRPRYRSIDRADPDCAVNPRIQSSGTEFQPGFHLTNIKGDDGDSDIWSIGLSKGYDWGLDWTLVTPIPSRAKSAR
jgi:hypothetical protein